MKPYTVLLLLPVRLREGHPSDWVERVHVEAEDPEGAAEVAISDLVAAGAGQESDLSVLAIYEDHLFDHFMP